MQIDIRITQPDLEHYDLARCGLVELLADAVRSGSSLGFLESLSADEAHGYWCEVRAAMLSGARLLWIAEHEGRVLGSVQLDLCQKKNGVNRAEVQKLLVHSAARRNGVARALMQALEASARSLDRGLLYLDTEAGSGAEPFYQACGYTYAGGLPEYACSPSGEWRANAIYYKTLFSRSTS